jgi:magnesium transporter
MGLERAIYAGGRRVGGGSLAEAREIIGFHRAVQPLASELGRFRTSPDMDPAMRRHLRGVEDRVLRAAEQAETFRELLSNILSVNLTMVSVRQNSQVQKISAWAAILVVPTIIAGIYGMNFRYMPELDWTFGYPYALGLMLVLCLLLYLGFKRSGWL